MIKIKDIDSLESSELFEVHTELEKTIDSLTVLLGYEDELQMQILEMKNKFIKKLNKVDKELMDKNICLNCGHLLIQVDEDTKICEFCKG